MSDSNRIERIAVIYNPEKPLAEDIAERIRGLLDANGRTVQVVRDARDTPPGPAADVSRTERIDDAGAVIVLGGDGTFLAVARAVALSPRPMLGINLGKFGFLTETAVSDLEEAIAHFLAGDFQLVHRSLLEVTVLRGDAEETFRSLAVNEALVSRAETGRLLHVSLSHGRHPVIAYKGDGLIVATPTGSTGHSLSAGGPILEPDLPAVVVTPVCAHSLFSRPLVFRGEDVLRLHFPEEMHRVTLTVDGQINHTCEPHDAVCVKRAHTIPTIQFPNRSFASMLRIKFGLEDLLHEERR